MYNRKIPPFWTYMALYVPGNSHEVKTVHRVAERPTKVIQSYLRIWGTYDPIESGPSDPKKWGLYRRSVKKSRFSGQNRAPAAAPRPAVQRGQHKNVVFLLSGHDGNKKVGRFWQKNGFWAKKLHFRPEILHFFTLHL